MLRWSLVVFALVVAAVVALVVTDGDAETQPPEPTATPTPTPTSTPAPTIADHLRAVQRIANEHGGMRAAGSPGDAATADYIEQQLRGAGYRVRRLRFRVPYYRETAPPRLRSGRRRVRPVRTMQFSPAGRASGRVRAAGGLGCARADFAALREGEIALVRRGTCFFRVKALNAQRAGAVAVLVHDEGARPVPASLERPGVRIPALSLGAAAADGLEGRRATVVVRAESGRRETSSVIGESGPAGARVVMAGAHLDSVPEGPGMNDNASGIAALLDVARSQADRDRPLRFAFWGAEEIGLVGSRRYVRGLSRAERRRITAYVNLDMVGTPRGRPLVYGDRRVVRALRRRLPPRVPETAIGDRSDHAPFRGAGIPVGGIFTGLDDCYHERCDRLRNVDAGLVEQVAHATEAALIELAS